MRLRYQGGRAHESETKGSNFPEVSKYHKKCSDNQSSSLQVEKLIFLMTPLAPFSIFRFSLKIFASFKNEQTTLGEDLLSLFKFPPRLGEGFD
jgi:hypothetical protein